MNGADTQEELREMVQSVALQLAARVIRSAEGEKLQQAHVVDEVDAAGACWHMRAVFFRETMCVRVSGHAVAKTPEPAQGVALDGVESGGVVFIDATKLAEMFGVGKEGPTFDYVVPVAWLLKAAGA